MYKAKILIVEDEWIIANDIKDCLIDMGYMVTGIAASCDEALQSIDSCIPDLILMDIVLKGDKNGAETAQIIQNEHKIPVIYLSAYDNQSLIDQTKQPSTRGYLLKPFKDRELTIAIDLALSIQSNIMGGI